MLCDSPQTGVSSGDKNTTDYLGQVHADLMVVLLDWDWGRKWWPRNNSAVLCSSSWSTGCLGCCLGQIENNQIGDRGDEYRTCRGIFCKVAPPFPACSLKTR